MKIRRNEKRESEMRRKKKNKESEGRKRRREAGMMRGKIEGREQVEKEEVKMKGD